VGKERDPTCKQKKRDLLGRRAASPLEKGGKRNGSCERPSWNSASSGGVPWGYVRASVVSGMTVSG